MATANVEYRAWIGMIARCTNPKNRSWHRYGGRGIAVCARWMVFENFLADMGLRPSVDHSLDRIDNNGNYSQDNCRWATRDVQNRNRCDNVWFELDGVRRTLTDWAAKIGLTVPALRARIDSGEWSLRDALTLHGHRPVRGQRHKLAKLTDEQAAEVVRRRRAGELLSVLAREFGVSESRISKMAKRRGEK